MSNSQNTNSMLSKFELDLKNLVEERNKPFTAFTEERNKVKICNPLPYNSSNNDNNNSNNNDDDNLNYLQKIYTYMAVSEHGQPYKQLTDSSKLLTRMAVSEHGQPYKQLRRLVTKMAVPQHGQPYKQPTDTSSIVTFMAVREHGQPYNRPTNSSSLFCEIAYDEKMDDGDY